jgi:hypothetical protein
MILTKEIEVRLNNKNIYHYKELLNCNYGDVISVPVSFLPKYSKYRIVAKCSVCDSENELSMQKYSKNVERGGLYTCKSCNNITYKQSMIEKYGFDNPSKVPICNEKRKETCLEKYGTEYVIQSEYSKEKSKETLIERYGIDHPMEYNEFRFKGVEKANKTKIDRGFIIPEELLSDWDKYRRLVRKLTSRNKKILFENWDGFDFYDGEYIKNNFKHDHSGPLYPTIDHKISVINGFKDNIDPETISSIENLCITKKTNNSSKSFLNEKEFKQKTQS